MIKTLDKFNALSLAQINDTYRVVDSIIDNLDDHAMLELLGGDNSDLDKLIEVIIEETSRTLYSRRDKITDQSFQSLSQLTGSVDETLRAECFNYFITTTLPTFEMYWFSIEWGNMVQMYPRLGVIAARGEGKSWFFSRAYPLWKLFRYRKPKSEERIRRDIAVCEEGMIITNEYSLAKRLLSGIRGEIEENEFLRARLMPDSKEGWGKEGLKVKTGAFITLKSYGSTMRGPHPGWIVVDDFLDKSCLYSKDQRDKFIETFHSEIMNMILNDGQVIVTGTPFHDEDLYGNLKDPKNKIWKIFEYPAIYPDGRLLNPHRNTLQGLLDKKESQGSIVFSREILVKPVTSGSTIFPYEMVSRCFTDRFKLIRNKYSLPTEFVRIVCGIDIARSANVGADYSVFTTLGVDKFDRYWILNIWREKGKTLNEQISQLKALHANFSYDIIIVEANQMQQFFVDSANAERLPVKPHITGTNKYDLDKGLPSLAILFEQEKILMPTGDETSKNTSDMLASELASMTWTEKGKLQGAGSHDDMTMSLLMAVIAAREGTSIGAIWI